MLIPFIAPIAAYAPAPSSAPDGDEVVVTASFLPKPKDESAASSTVVEKEDIDALGVALVDDLVRLTPGASVNRNGAAGSFTQVRIRGAEANHTLLIVDGIKTNDFTVGDEPRFELLNVDMASSLEIVRGPQSAIWGSQAIGGVIAVNPRRDTEPGFRAALEGGSFGTRRASTGFSSSGNSDSLDIGLGWQRADGIDIGGGGERDGYRNLSGRALGRKTIGSDVVIGINGFFVRGESDYDLIGPYSVDEHLKSKSDISAGRIFFEKGSDNRSGVKMAASLFDTRNRNLTGDVEDSRTYGQRLNILGQAHHRLKVGSTSHQIVLAAEQEQENFHARDVAYGGLSDQDRKRTRRSLTVGLLSELRPFSIDVALRHDDYGGRLKATTFRGAVLADVTTRVQVFGSYSEGFAPPTFTELYGYFPGQFFGNPNLRPEKSKGVEAGLRFSAGPIRANLVAFRQRLVDEIDVFYNYSGTSEAYNYEGLSNRKGVEAEADWTLGKRWSLHANYSYLSAREFVCCANLQELRRPKHSGAIAATGQLGQTSVGASISYTGERTDEIFVPAGPKRVRLDPYWLVGARVERPITKRLNLFVRGSNLLDQRYEDVSGYRTEGRGLYVGIRLADPRSSR